MKPRPQPPGRRLARTVELIPQEFLPHPDFILRRRWHRQIRKTLLLVGALVLGAVLVFIAEQVAAGDLSFRVPTWVKYFLEGIGG